MVSLTHLALVAFLAWVTQAGTPSDGAGHSRPVTLTVRTGR